jgi:XisH protein
MGQYDSYFYALADLEPDRLVILAISEEAWNVFFSLSHVTRLCELKTIPVIVVDLENQNIVQWIK